MVLKLFPHYAHTGQMSHSFVNHASGNLSSILIKSISIPKKIVHVAGGDTLS